MAHKQAGPIDYQTRATEFAVGDQVFPFGSTSDMMGRVVAVYPAIGMVEVLYPTGTIRSPVEDLQHFKSGPGASPKAPDKGTESTPGGASTVITESPGKPGEAATRKVAQAYVKKALYWAAKDRHYKATKAELEGGKYACPKCGEPLRRAAYQRAGGVSEHLYGCSGCLWLIRACDVQGDPTYVDDSLPQVG